MSSGAVAELAALLRDQEIQGIIKGAKHHLAQEAGAARESARRLVRLAALAEVILREAGAEGEGAGRGGGA